MVKTAKVIFKVKVHTIFQQTVRITGSIHELGMWKPSEGVLLTTDQTKFPFWQSISSIQLPQKSFFEFKFIIMKNNQVIRWQSIQNRKLTIQDNQYIICTWNQPLIELKSLKESENQQGQDKNIVKIKSTIVHSPRKIINKNSSIYQQIETREMFPDFKKFILIYNDIEQASASNSMLLKKYGCYIFSIFEEMDQGKKSIQLINVETVQNFDQYVGMDDCFVCIKQKNQIINYRKQSLPLNQFKQQNDRQMSELSKCRLISFNSFKRLGVYMNWIQQNKYQYKKFKYGWIVMNQYGYQIILVNNFRTNQKQVMTLYQLKNTNQNLVKQTLNQINFINKQIQKYVNFWYNAILQVCTGYTNKKDLQKINKRKSLLILKFQIHKFNTNLFKKVLFQTLNNFQNIYWIIQNNIQTLPLLLGQLYNKVNILSKRGSIIKLRNQQFKTTFDNQPIKLINLIKSIEKHNLNRIFRIKQYSQFDIQIIRQLPRIYEAKKQTIINEIKYFNNVNWQQIDNRLHIYTFEQRKVIQKIVSGQSELVIIGDFNSVMKGVRVESLKINSYKSLFQLNISCN